MKNKIIKNLAKRAYIVGIKRNILTIFAILLTTFMLTAICSIGLSYWGAVTKRSVLLEGMKYDVELPEPTEEQVKKAADISEILYAGLTVKCAIVDEVDSKSVNEIRLFWSDKTNWEKQCIPAFEFMNGTYPEKDNEIILSNQTLKDMGVNNPEIGMSIELHYNELSEEGRDYQKEMVLTGYYRDYSGNNNGYVSESFYKETGAKQTDITQGSLKITLRNPLYSTQTMKEMEEAFGMNEYQRIFYDPGLLQSFVRLVSGLVILLAMVLLCGYLFIYNILYISVSKDIRFYGQLKTVGMTSRQIKQFIYLQSFWNSIIGIPLGMALGAAVSLLLMPFILRILNPTLGTDSLVSFNPLIFIGGAIFAVFTVWIGSRKPAMIASQISPIEALRYTLADTRRKSSSSVNGGKPFYMAWRNIFRDRKQALIIFLSFFVALSTFLVINIIVERNSAKNILNTFYSYDIRVLNQSVPEEQPLQAITDNALNEIMNQDEVMDAHEVYTAKIVIPYDEPTLGEYFKSIYESPIATGNYDEDMKAYKENPDSPMFHGNLVGIDKYTFDKLNKELGYTINEEEFMAGEAAIMKPSLGIPITIPEDNDLMFILPDSTEHSVRLNGISLSIGPNYFAAGYSPDIIVSQQFFKEIVADPIIELVDIDYKKSFDKNTDEIIENIFKDEPEVTFESKMDDYVEMRQSEDQMKLLGKGLGMILAVLAIMNYCNMIVTGIQNRSKEFAILQSIGMTTRQIKKVLVLEGLGYGVISSSLVMIFGIPISYFVYQSFNSYNIPFKISLTENLILFITIIITCVIVPLIAYRTSQKDDLIERIKFSE